jgi:hypothetical protein
MVIDCDSFVVISCPSDFILNIFTLKVQTITPEDSLPRNINVLISFPYTPSFSQSGP